MTTQPATPNTDNRPFTHPDVIAAAVKARTEGQTLAQIGATYGVTRERVRQVLAASDAAPTAEQARAAALERKQQERAREKTTIADAATANPAATVDELATITGLPATTISRALGKKERARRRPAVDTTPTVTGDDALNVVRKVAEANPGKPLSMSAYKAGRPEGEGLSAARLVQLHGTWNKALAAAGLPHNAPNRKTYTSRYSPDQLRAILAEYLSDPTQAGTFNGFDAWLKANNKDVSAHLFRDRLGGWTNLVREWAETRA